MRLDKEDRKRLALWAADCADHVLPLFEKEDPHDDRPRRAVEAARAWARGEMPFREARAAALAAHAAARAADQVTARAAARAAGHAAATAHAAGHARGAAAYAVTAASGGVVPLTAAADLIIATTRPARAADATGAFAAATEEREWQLRQLPQDLRPLAFPDR